MKTYWDSVVPNILDFTLTLIFHFSTKFTNHPWWNSRCHNFPITDFQSELKSIVVTLKFWEFPIIFFVQKVAEMKILISIKNSVQCCRLVKSTVPVLWLRHPGFQLRQMVQVVICIGANSSPMSLPEAEITLVVIASTITTETEVKPNHLGNSDQIWAVSLDDVGVRVPLSTLFLTTTTKLWLMLISIMLWTVSRKNNNRNPNLIRFL